VRPPEWLPVGVWLRYRSLTTDRRDGVRRKTRNLNRPWGERVRPCVSVGVAPLARTLHHQMLVPIIHHPPCCVNGRKSPYQDIRCRPQWKRGRRAGGGERFWHSARPLPKRAHRPERVTARAAGLRRLGLKRWGQSAE